MIDIHADCENVTVHSTGPIQLQAVEVAEAVHNWVWQLAGGDREKARTARRHMLNILADDEIWEILNEDADPLYNGRSLAEEVRVAIEMDSPKAQTDKPDGWWDDMWPTYEEGGVKP